MIIFEWLMSNKCAKCKWTLEITEYNILMTFEKQICQIMGMTLIINPIGWRYLNGI